MIALFVFNMTENPDRHAITYPCRPSTHLIICIFLSNLLRSCIRVLEKRNPLSRLSILGNASKNSPRINRVNLPMTSATPKILNYQNVGKFCGITPSSWVSYLIDACSIIRCLSSSGCLSGFVNLCHWACFKISLNILCQILRFHVLWLRWALNVYLLDHCIYMLSSAEI